MEKHFFEKNTAPPSPHSYKSHTGYDLNVLSKWIRLIYKEILLWITKEKYVNPDAHANRIINKYWLKSDWRFIPMKSLNTDSSKKIYKLSH